MGLLPIDRLARWLHARREHARTHCSNCDARIEDGPGFCSDDCSMEQAAAYTP